MQILNDTILKDKYDVIVLGAGIGGITAGALLAKKGYQVLIVEQHYLPGGVCTSIKREGTAMDAGAALLFGWGKGSPHWFVMNELEEEIDMIQHESLYKMHFDDKSVTFWRDFDKYFKELNEAFPGREDQFKGFYDECFKVYEAMKKIPMLMSPDTMSRGTTLKMLLKNPLNVVKMPKMMNTSMKDVLDKYVKDPFVEGFFDLVVASCYCTSIEETPLMLASAVVCSAHDKNEGAFYPSGSPQMLPNKIESALERFNGQILYRRLVDEILISDGEAYGVKLEDGTEILGDRIISDATIWNLYGSLIKKEHISPERMEWAHKFVSTTSAVIIYISVNAEVFPEGTHAIEAFINPKDLLKDNYFVYIPSIDDPSISPEGVHSVSILCSAEQEIEPWPRPWDPDYQQEAYVARKQKIADRALNVLEEKFPGFKKGIRTIDIATPATTERFTLKNWGNIGGPKQALGQHLLNRMKIKSPDIKNLFCVGDSTSLGEGVVSVTTSGISAANLILRDDKRKEYDFRKFSKEHVSYLKKGYPRSPLPAKTEPITEDTASRHAVECQWCEDPKCISKCPAGIDIPNFIRRIESGNYAGAAKSIREMNPLGAICGYLCPAEKLCESECNHLDFSDFPVRIADLQSWVCKKAGKDGWLNENSLSLNKKVAIIGAGPAGLSCGHYLATLGYQVDIFEKTDSIGGLITQVIPQDRMDYKVVLDELKSISSSDRIKISFNQELGKDVQLSELKNTHEAIFLSTGLSSGKMLSLEGSENNKSTDALNFLRNYHIDQKVNINGTVLIIGGGSVAADVAHVISKETSNEVIMVCLESDDEMLCLPSELNDLKSNNVKILTSLGPKELVGNKLICRKCISVFDSNGCFDPEFDEASLQEITFDHLIFAIGQKMDENLAKYLETELKLKIIDIDNTTQLISNQSNVYAGGDLTRGAGTIVEAVADGRRAAKAIHEKLFLDK